MKNIAPTIPFSIESLDPLGQGVSKISDKICFIPKVLPGEEGQVTVIKDLSKICFGEVDSISKFSPDRISPECIHYSQCSGCQYQHTPYEKEIFYKHQSLQSIFRKLSIPPIEVVPAENRFFYRNRVQLHYDLKNKTIGFKHQNKIIEIPQCLLGNEKIKTKLAEFYKNQQWLKLIPPYSPLMGHLEIYEKGDDVQVTWNKNYADGGFTQVNHEMNLKLKKIITDIFQEINPPNFLELFAGDGNLVENIKPINSLHFDIYSGPIKKPNYFNQDLYAQDSLTQVWEKWENQFARPPTMLVLDPPRSGFNKLSYWIEKLKLDYVLYVSCDPNTMARDLLQIDSKKFSIKKLFLIDLFPATYHYESLVLLHRLT